MTPAPSLARRRPRKQQMGQRPGAYQGTAGRVPLGAMHHPEASVTQSLADAEVPLADQTFKGGVFVQPGRGRGLGVGGLFVFGASHPCEHLAGAKRERKRISAHHDATKQLPAGEYRRSKCPNRDSSGPLRRGRKTSLTESKSNSTTQSVLELRPSRSLSLTAVNPNGRKRDRLCNFTMFRAAVVKRTPQS